MPQQPLAYAGENIKYRSGSSFGMNGDGSNRNVLLPSKLTSPVKSPSFVPRSRLDELFHHAAAAKLVLIQAPAGYGKTTAMIQLKTQLKEQGENTAWLSLDESDNDPGRFLIYLMAAMQTADPSLELEDLSKDHSKDLSSRDTSEVERLLNLLARLPASQNEFSLFLDEFETIHNAEINNILRQVLKHLPAGRRLVITSRNIPDLGLARMRAQGELAMIGADELRFDLEETESFLCTKRNLNLDEEDLARMHQKIEGWVVGLQLVSIALAGRKDNKTYVQSVSGSFSDIADYLTEDVFAAQPEEVRNFLLQTCILEHLSPSLCDWVTGRTDSREMLLRLERANLFLLPLDDERHWYRFHALFAEFLRGMLEREAPDSVLELHSKAAHWFSRQGDYEDAVRHALAAGDEVQAAEMMTECVKDLFHSGQLHTIVDWAERLQPEILKQRTKLKLSYCWALAFLGRYRDAIRLQGEMSAEAVEIPLDQAAKDDILALRPMCLAFMDRMEEALKEASGNLAQLTRSGGWAHGVLGNIVAYGHLIEGKFADASEMAFLALRCHTQVGDIFGQGYSRWIEIRIKMIQGHLLEALALSRTSLAKVQEASTGLSRSSTVAVIILSQILYEMNELSEAQQLLEQHEEALKLAMPLDIMVMGHTTLARIYYAHGAYDDALSLLGKAEEVTRRLETPRLAMVLQQEKVRLALRRGDKLRAEQQLREIEGSEVWQAFSNWTMPASNPETPEIQSLRVRLRLGKAAEVLQPLASALTKAEKAARYRQALTLRILEAEALDACDDRPSALRVLGQALTFAAPQGYVRAFADEGEAVVRLIREMRKTVIAGTSGEHADISTQYLDSILSAAGKGRSSIPGMDKPQAPESEPELEQPVESLSDREKEVLEMVASGCSNREAAEKLFVSEATVKFHLHNINSKLGVNSRNKAVVLARRLGLIP